MDATTRDRLLTSCRGRETDERLGQINRKNVRFKNTGRSITVFIVNEEKIVKMNLILKSVKVIPKKRMDNLLSLTDLDWTKPN